MKGKSESEVVQPSLTLCDPMDCSLRGSSIHGVFQARVLEWGAIAFSARPLRYGLKQFPYNCAVKMSILPKAIYRFNAIPNGNPLQYSCLENPMGRGDW